jgi:hypothetical protein
MTVARIEAQYSTGKRKKRPPLRPEPTSRRGRYHLREKEELMSIIHARRDDWIPANPRIRVGGWIGAFVAMGIVYVAVAGVIGHFVSGNGSPFLLGL